MKHELSVASLVVCQDDSVPKVSSQTIAEVFGKNHSHVLRNIRKLMVDLPEDFTQSNFGLSNFLDATGRELPMYYLTRDAFSLLAMSFTGKEALMWKIRYIDAFNQMEKAIRSNLLLSGPEAPVLIRKVLGFARRLTPERKLEIKRAVRYQALGLSKAEVGRLLGCGPTKAGNLLREHRWLKGGE